MSKKCLEQLDEKIKGHEYFHNNLTGCSQLDVAFYKFYDMYYIFAGANFNIGGAEDETLSLEGYETSNPNILRIFLRGEYAKSVILSYSSIEDYMMQIIVFVYITKKITSKKDYNMKSSNNYYKDVMKKIQKNNNEELKIVSNILKGYHDNNNIIRIRELANKLKHNNNISFVGLPSASPIIRSKGDGKGRISYSSNWIKPKREDIDDLVNLFYEANIIIKKYVEDIYILIVKKFNKYNLEEL